MGVSCHARASRSGKQQIGLKCCTGKDIKTYGEMVCLCHQTSQVVAVESSTADDPSNEVAVGE